LGTKGPYPLLPGHKNEDEKRNSVVIGTVTGCPLNLVQTGNVAKPSLPISYIMCACSTQKLIYKYGEGCRSHLTQRIFT
jgi:hypothetical protein